MDDPFLRPAQDEDSVGVILLIENIFGEYANCILDVDMEEPKLRTPASSYHRFWVVQQKDSIVGCIACGPYPKLSGGSPSGPTECPSVQVDESSPAGFGKKPPAGSVGQSTYFELQKLYVASCLRGQGWGRRLVEVVEQEARRLGHSQIELWTDTRFETAHHVYQILGYRRTGHSRELHDLSQTVEYHFIKDLSA